MFRAFLPHGTRRNRAATEPGKFESRRARESPVRELRFEGSRRFKVVLSTGIRYRRERTTGGFGCDEQALLAGTTRSSRFDTCNRLHCIIMRTSADYSATSCKRKSYSKIHVCEVGHLCLFLYSQIIAYNDIDNIIIVIIMSLLSCFVASEFNPLKSFKISR